MTIYQPIFLHNSITFYFPNYLVCFDIKTVNGESNQYEDETWNLGTCSKSFSGYQESPFDMFTSYASAIQRCCLAPKNYDLTCHDSSRYHDGWNGGALEIFGHKYCDDFVDRIVRRKVEVSCKYRVLEFHLFAN